MPVSKLYLTIDDQIDNLKNQGLIFSNEKKARSILKTHSYYSIVNCYCDLLVNRKSPRQFKVGATFDELLAIRDFDTSFRRFLFPQVLYVEEKFKAILINGYCGAKNAQGGLIHSEDDYLCLDSFETTNVVKKKAATKLIIELSKAIESNKSKDPFKYQMKTYGYVPLWTLAGQMTFGQTSRFFECCTPEIRSSVANVLRLSESELRTVLKILNVVRNCCAHNNRVFSVGIPEMLPLYLGVGRKKIATDRASDHKFGSVLYCLKFLLSTKKFAKIIKELNAELKRLHKSLKTIPFTSVLRKMGISTSMVQFFGIEY
jgi:abortive infection bacteriophage resistance protein